jgi:hypothetical protein
MLPRNRIIIFALICIGIILIGIGSWTTVLGHGHPTYNAVVLSVLVLAGGVFVLSMSMRGLRRGVIVINAKGSIRTYERRNSPVMFWFYVILFGVGGFVISGLSIYWLFQPSLLK